MNHIDVDPTPSPPARGDRAPWDPANGLRVGLLAGALIGAGLIALTGLTGFWIIAITTVVGGIIGYRSEKRKQPR